MVAPALEVDGVSKFFGAFRAVDRMSLSLEPGEIHALIGPNGAGKSTLLNVIAGGLAPDGGDVCHDGVSIVGLKPHEIVRAGIARSFQITSIFPGLNVAENVRVALMGSSGACRKWYVSSASVLRDEVARLLADVHLEDRRDRPSAELAAGDRKRLEFAMALAGRPRLMLLDEPTAGMSPSERALVSEMVQDINRRHGVSVLFTEHDIDMVFSVAHRITVMHQGAKLASGLPAEVRGDPRVRQTYLGEDCDA